LEEIKNEKTGNYEFISAKDDKYFECDKPRGPVNGGMEDIIKFSFKPPTTDPLL